MLFASESGKWWWKKESGNKKGGGLKCVDFHGGQVRSVGFSPDGKPDGVGPSITTFSGCFSQEDRGEMVKRWGVLAHWLLGGCFVRQDFQEKEEERRQEEWRALCKALFSTKNV
jgi:hypothetical protein